jgi:hypothetical protein
LIGLGVLSVGSGASGVPIPHIISGLISGTGQGKNAENAPPWAYLCNRQPTMAIKDDIAKLSNGAELTYLDTGVPEGVTNYRTFIFVHGAAHNKCTTTR